MFTVPVLFFIQISCWISNLLSTMKLNSPTRRRFLKYLTTLDTITRRYVRLIALFSSQNFLQHLCFHSMCFFVPSKKTITFSRALNCSFKTGNLHTKYGLIFTNFIEDELKRCGSDILCSLRDEVGICKFY